jgi:hypothetical protein
VAAIPLRPSSGSKEANLPTRHRVVPKIEQPRPDEYTAKVWGQALKPFDQRYGPHLVENVPDMVWRKLPPVSRRTGSEKWALTGCEYNDIMI